MKPVHAPEAVLFDWDNTLIDNWPSIQAALNATLEWAGMEPWTLAETKARVRGSLRDTFPGMFGDRWEAARDLFYSTLEDVHLDTVEPLPGARDLLDELSGTGIYLGVVSNKTGSYLRREAAHLGWEHLFRRIIGAADAAEDKPAPAPLHMALDAAPGVRMEDVWYVGDTATDMLCAHNAGCVGILVRADAPGQGDGVDEPLFGEITPHRYLPTLPDLSRFLSDLR